MEFWQLVHWHAAWIQTKTNTSSSSPLSPSSPPSHHFPPRWPHLGVRGRCTRGGVEAGGVGRVVGRGRFDYPRYSVGHVPACLRGRRTGRDTSSQVVPFTLGRRNGRDTHQVVPTTRTVVLRDIYIYIYIHIYSCTYTFSFVHLGGGP